MGQKVERGGRASYFKRVQGLVGDLGIAHGFSSLGVRKPGPPEPDSVLETNMAGHRITMLMECYSFD